MAAVVIAVIGFAALRVGWHAWQTEHWLALLGWTVLALMMFGWAANVKRESDKTDSASSN